MKPIYSDEERNKIVRNFIMARYEGLVKIRSFGAIVPYLEERRVKLLYDLGQSGFILVTESYKDTPKKYYIESDAKEYFDWLTSIVTGAQNAPESAIKEANDQLFIFILALRNDTDIKDRVKLIEPYNWERDLNLIAERLVTFQEKTDKRDKDITAVLSSILIWMKKYNPTLNAVTKDCGNQLGKVSKK